MQTFNSKTISQRDSEVDSMGANQLTAQSDKATHRSMSLQCAEHHNLSSHSNVYSVPVVPFPLAWHIPFANWRDAMFMRVCDMPMHQQSWLELAYFAYEKGIQSPHGATPELLWEFLESMANRGLTPAARRSRLGTFQSVFRFLSERKILKSNPASRLPFFPL